MRGYHCCNTPRRAETRGAPKFVSSLCARATDPFSQSTTSVSSAVRDGLPIVRRATSRQQARDGRRTGDARERRNCKAASTRLRREAATARRGRRTSMKKPCRVKGDGFCERCGYTSPNGRRSTFARRGGLWRGKRVMRAETSSAPTKTWASHSVAIPKRNIYASTRSAAPVPIRRAGASGGSDASLSIRASRICVTRPAKS